MFKMKPLVFVTYFILNSSLYAQSQIASSPIEINTSIQTSTTAASSNLTPEEKSFFASHLSDIVTLEPSRITDNNLQSVFSASFYNVKVKFIDGVSTTMTVMRAGNNLLPIPDTSTNRSEMPGLVQIINPTFKLATNDDAKKLQDALDVIYPIDAFRGAQNNLQAKMFWKNGNQWTFIRGTFFQSLKGFIFTTNQNGTITAIAYSLRIPLPNQGQTAQPVP